MVLDHPCQMYATGAHRKTIYIMRRLKLKDYHGLSVSSGAQGVVSVALG